MTRFLVGWRLACGGGSLVNYVKTRCSSAEGILGGGISGTASIKRPNVFALPVGLAYDLVE